MCSDIWAVLLDMFRRIKQDKSTTWRFQRPHKQANHLGRVAYFKRFLFFLHSPGPGPSEVLSKDLYQAYWKSYVSFQQSGSFLAMLKLFAILLKYASSQGGFSCFLHVLASTQKNWKTIKWKKNANIGFYIFWFKIG